jgi:hypothetical protein
VSSVNATPKKGRRQAREWRPAFIAGLRNGGNVRAAALAAGVDRHTVYRAREASPEFAQEWTDALEDACDILEAVATERAKASSDTLLIFLLKAHRPEKYRDQVLNKFDGNVTLRILDDDDDADRPPAQALSRAAGDRA